MHYLGYGMTNPKSTSMLNLKLSANVGGVTESNNIQKNRGQPDFLDHHESKFKLHFGPKVFVHVGFSKATLRCTHRI